MENFAIGLRQFFIFLKALRITERQTGLSVGMAAALTSLVLVGSASAAEPAKPCDLTDPNCQPGGSVTVPVPSRTKLPPPSGPKLPGTPPGPGSSVKRQICLDYSANAVADYKIMRGTQQCFLKDDARWQPFTKNHYNWCVTAKPGWLDSENKARKDYLVNCGGKHG